LALDNGVSAEALREVILTAYLFDGYPAALEGFRLLASILGKPKLTTIPRYTNDEVRLWRERGERLCRVIYGPQFKKLTDHVLEIAPELSDSMIVEGYGKVLARDNLDVRLRELCVVAILAMKGRARQLLSHILGALRLGVSEADLRRAMDAAAMVASPENMLLARSVLDDALRRFTK